MMLLLWFGVGAVVGVLAGSFGVWLGRRSVSRARRSLDAQGRRRVGL